jgi:RNA polymerase sigma-70 factor (ECF subfamily)
MAQTLDEPIQNALEALPVEFRLVVVLADIEGLSYEEVARIAGCPVGTVRSRLHRGRAILKDKLKNYVRF